jgi:integrase
MSAIQKRQRRRTDGTLGPVHWRAYYRDVNGQQRSQTFDRKVDAERFLERNGAAIQRGDWIDPAGRRVTFKQWADDWWATTVKLRVNTRRGYWRLLTGHVLPYFGARSLAAIDFLDVERFIADKLEDGHSVKHVREMVTIVSNVIKTAMRANARKDNPAAGHALQPPRKRIRQGDALTMEQAADLVSHVTAWYRPAVWLLVYTGMRPAELCGLLVGDVDLMRALVHVDHTYSPIPAFSGAARQHVDGPTKTEAAERTIPIPRWLCDDLGDMLASRDQVSRTDHLFVNQQGRPVNRDTFRAKIIRPALRRAGLPEDFRTYDFRHSHASQLIDAGANPLAVAQRMGHSDPSVTLRVYGHLFEGVQAQLTERLEASRQAAGQVPAQGILLPLPGQQDTGIGYSVGSNGQHEGGKRRSKSVKNGQPRSVGNRV